MRALKVLAGAAVGVAVIGGFVVYRSLNSLIREAVVTLGPKLTGTEVRLRSVRVLPLLGQGSLRGFAVGNPKGWSDADAVSVGRVHLELVPRSLLTDTVVVKRVEVLEPELRYEGSLSDSNLKQLQRNVESAAASLDGSGASKGKSKADGPAKKLVIDEVVVRGAKVQVLLRPLKTPMTVALPEVRVTGIGRKGGATPAQAAAKVLDAVLDETLKGVAKAGQSVEGAVKAVEAVGRSLEQGIKGFFKK